MYERDTELMDNLKVGDWVAPYMHKTTPENQLEELFGSEWKTTEFQVIDIESCEKQCTGCPGYISLTNIDRKGKCWGYNNGPWRDYGQYDHNILVIRPTERNKVCVAPTKINLGGFNPQRDQK